MDTAAITQPWNFSILVDAFGRIQEVRGQVAEHLGATIRSMVGKPIMALIGDADQKSFLRFFSQFGTSTLPPPCRIHLAPPAKSEMQYLLHAEQGPVLSEFWLLFYAGNDDRHLGDREGASAPAQFQDETRLLGLIELAAAQKDAKLDLTILNVDALSSPEVRKRLQPEDRAGFEGAVDKMVLSRADSGVVGKPAVGRYSLLHDRGQPPKGIEQEIREAAAKFGLADGDLGLRSVTVEVKPGASIAELRTALTSAYRAVQNDLDDFEENSSFWDRTKLLLIGLASIAIGSAIGIYLASNWPD